MNKEELRDQFYKETNVAPVFANRIPYINYIEWLENKILNVKFERQEKFKQIEKNI